MRELATRSGLKARLLATDIKDELFPVAVAITGLDGKENVYLYTASLTYQHNEAPHQLDLVDYLPSLEARYAELEAKCKQAELDRDSYMAMASRLDRELDEIKQIIEGWD